MGDSAHNFVDGALIGAAALVSVPLAVSTAIAALAHEIPHELGDFAILLNAGYSRTRALVLNGLSESAGLVGAFAAAVCLGQLPMPQLDLLIYGHFHQLIYEEGSGCGMLINGSIKGYDEFILKTKYSGQTPIQALLTFHPRHGLTDLSRINLGHVQSGQKIAA